MSRRIFAALTAAAAFLATPASAQFQPRVMKLPAWAGAELAPGRWDGPGSGHDLLVLDGTGTPQAALFEWRDLITPLGWSYAVPATATAAATGRFDGSPTGPSPEVAWAASRDLSVTWGADPGTRETFLSALSRTPHGLGAVRLLPRAAPLLAVTYGDFSETNNEVCVVDLASARGTAPTPLPGSWTQCWSFFEFPSAEDGETLADRVQSIRLSASAVANGVDEPVVPVQWGFRLLWNETPAGAIALDDLVVTPVTIGSADSGVLTALLPAGMPLGGSCLGVGALDMDGDGDRDLLFSYSDESALRTAPGYLLWIENTGVALELESATWSDLTSRTDLQPIVDPGLLRQLDLGGERVLVVHDRGLDELLVLRGSGAAGFSAQRLPAFGATVRDAVAEDVVGSTAPDLIVRVVTAGGLHEVWVYPDDGDLATTLAWEPALPAAALAGIELPLGVVATDPDPVDTPVALDWFVAGTPGPVATGTAWTVPAAQLCGPSSTLDVTVRALDELGVYTELAASIPIEGRPALWLAGSPQPVVITLAPGGAAGRAEGEAWPACGGSPAFTWGESGLAGLVETAAGGSGSTAWREFDLPEGSYPDLLDGAAALTLRAADGVRDGTTTLPLRVDARGLVVAAASFDRAALADGELGAARLRLASRIGVPLPRIRVRVRLAGLARAGEPQILGAPSSPGGAEGEWIVDPLPPSPAEVEIVLPVRSLGSRGAVAVELFSEGGDRVSPEASPGDGPVRLPGCGCGDGGGGPLGLLLALGAAAHGRRRRPT